jgi:hypothetical protein
MAVLRMIMIMTVVMMVMVMMIVMTVVMGLDICINSGRIVWRDR